MATIRTGNRTVLLVVHFQVGVAAQARDAARPAQGILDDLGVAMNWVAYPGRVVKTATAAEVEFA